jgi:hypothetical protein
MSRVSLDAKKTFIVENASLLNAEVQRSILRLVIMEVGTDDVFEAGGARGVDVDLDAVAAANPDVLTHIYNIVRTRREVLCTPKVG